METTRALLERLPGQLRLGPGAARVTATFHDGQLQRPVQIAKFRLAPRELDNGVLDIDQLAPEATAVLEKIAGRMGLAAGVQQFIAEYGRGQNGDAGRLRWLDVLWEV